MAKGRVMTQQEVQAQAGKVLAQVAGYVGVRTIQIGLRSGLLGEISKQPAGITARSLSERTGFDDLYVEVWCRSAYASEILDLGEGETYRLAPHMNELLLDADFPGWIGAIPGVLDEPEMFDVFEQRLESGQRTWWDEASHDFIAGVSGTGRPFYTRLIPNGLGKITGLAEKLESGAAVAELACGAGTGLIRFADSFPKCTLAGVDGDKFSLELSQAKVKAEGIEDRVTLELSTFEDWSPAQKFDMVFINISMHECRDLEKVTRNVRDSLKPGGHFVISDMPFPKSTEECRTVPARIMCGIQFWEAQIDDQLMPTSDFEDLLGRHGFVDIDSFEMTPVHAVIHGRKE